MKLPLLDFPLIFIPIILIWVLKSKQYRSMEILVIISAVLSVYSLFVLFWPWRLYDLLGNFFSERSIFIFLSYLLAISWITAKICVMVLPDNLYEVSPSIFILIGLLLDFVCYFILYFTISSFTLIVWKLSKNAETIFQRRHL